MDAHVLGKVGVPRERLEANAARKRLDTRMHNGVLAQIRASGKRALALRAIVRLIVLMNALEMGRELAPVTKAHFALLAVVGRGVVMCRCFVCSAFCLTCTYIKKTMISKFFWGYYIFTLTW